MKVLKASRVRLIGAIVVLIVAAGGAPVQGQPRDPVPPRVPDMTLRGAGGATIGVGVRDVDAGEAERQKLKGGVLIEEVRTDSPAERAGLRTSDVVTEFDGELVRSARQFSRLVQETPPGRTVTVAVVRDGRRTELSITPEPGRSADVFIDRDRMAERLGDLGNRLPFNFDFDIDGGGTRARLGVSVEELTPQLATYFGAKDGLLVSVVADNSAASRAGLRAGDVITSVDGRPVTSRPDLLRALREGSGGQDVTLGIVRDKKESTIKATLEGAPRRPSRPARFTRTI
jgi:serine protease Do